jgi:hypothetical protein
LISGHYTKARENNRQLENGGSGKSNLWQIRAITNVASPGLIYKSALFIGFEGG